MSPGPSVAIIQTCSRQSTPFHLSPSYNPDLIGIPSISAFRWCNNQPNPSTFALVIATSVPLIPCQPLFSQLTPSHHLCGFSDVLGTLYTSHTPLHIV